MAQAIKALLLQSSIHCWVVVVFGLILPAAAFAAHDEDYREGLMAYMDGDYESAQAFWVKAAKNNDAKSMFNLGLLHEQSKITNADSDKAERWFKLAGQNGYAAADFHYANQLLKRKAPSSEVLLYLQRAVQNGSHPAKALLVKVSGGKVDPEQIIQATSPELVKADITGDLDKNIGDLETARIERYLTEKWINAKSSSSWTIQLLAFEDQAKVRQFIDDHGLHHSAAYFAERNSSGALYKLVYGAYSSKELADEARKALSADLREYGPWLRSIDSVQAIIAKQ